MVLEIVVVVVIVVVVGLLCAALTKTATTSSLGQLGLLGGSTFAFFRAQNVVVPPSANIPVSSQASGRHGGDGFLVIMIGPFSVFFLS